jgi:SAM-dependent methyltransferase
MTSLIEALRTVDSLQGWDWSRTRTRHEPIGWSYPDVVRQHVPASGRVLDVGTGGGEVFSAIARPGDVAIDVNIKMLAVAQRNLSCPVVAGHNGALPFHAQSFALVASRHVGADPREVLRVLTPEGIYVTQQVGARSFQSIFDAFGWGSNGEFWRREFAESGEQLWDVETMAAVYEEEGCEIVRREEADVDYEYRDEESLAFWLANAPLPERADPDRHADVLAHCR